MKFYGRQQQIVHLQQYSRAAAAGNSSLTLLVGRRRVGKTCLLRETYKNDKKFLYFFVSRKSEVLLCEEFIKIVAELYEIPQWAQLTSIRDILTFIFEQSIEQNVTLVIDEFQDFNYVNASIFSDLQNIWDSYKHKCKAHLILCGSIYSIMCKLFENSKEPLFGRADRKIHLKPLTPFDLKEILLDNNAYTEQNLLDLYTLTGGIPRYIELLWNIQAWTLESILQAMLSEESFFLEEGKDVLIIEFGKDYQTYFSILALIASGKTNRSAIESVLQISVGGFIEKLEADFDIIKRYTSILSKPNSKQIKYYIQDNFLNFWFKYFYVNNSALQMGNYAYVIQEIVAGYSTYSGKFLERLVMEILSASSMFNKIGSYWETGNLNEIDVVAINERERRAVFCDVKLQEKKINIEALKFKSKTLQLELPGFSYEFTGYSVASLDTLLGTLPNN